MKLIKEASPWTVFSGKDTYHDLKLADDITRIRMLYAEHGYVRANVLDPIIEIKPRRVFRTLPLIKAPFPWGIPVPAWTKTIDRYYITVKVEENEQYGIGDVKVVGARQFNAEFIRAVLGLIPGAIYNETAVRKCLDEAKETIRRTGSHQFHSSAGTGL